MINLLSGNPQSLPDPSREGGLNVDAYRDANRVWHNSYLFYSTDRPSHQVAANGSFFTHTGSLGHEGGCAQCVSEYTTMLVASA